MTTPVSLTERLSEALGGHDVHPEDRMKIQDAYMDAGMEDGQWSDLPPDVQALVEEIEKTPRTSWDDPADVPDELPE